MSQAHYERCTHATRVPARDGAFTHFDYDVRCTETAVVIMHMPYFFGPKYRMCLDHMIEFFDKVDADDEAGDPFRHAEPIRLEWVWDSGTRTCPLHHWPDVVCRDWSAEHAAMIRALLTPTGG